MKRSVTILPLAIKDIDEAMLWYESKRVGLGREFVGEVDQSVSRIAENPRQFPRIKKDPEIRRALTERFPYRLFFIVDANAIHVFRVLHSARHDREWKSRVPSG